MAWVSDARFDVMKIAHEMVIILLWGRVTAFAWSSLANINKQPNLILHNPYQDVHHLAYYEATYPKAKQSNTPQVAESEKMDGHAQYDTRNRIMKQTAHLPVTTLRVQGILRICFKMGWTGRIHIELLVIFVSQN
jgi:hypothetical protein